MSVHYDVAVIGAGPSGAWAATRLAHRGARVALVDSSHPREKPCGGGVTGRALALIAGAIPRDRLPAVVIRSARFVDSAAASEAVVPLALDDDALIVASRAEFDGLVYQAAAEAGAHLVRSRVAHINRIGSGFHLDTADGQSLTAATVVAADGANSLARRTLATAFRRDQLSIATGFFAHGVTSDEIVIEMMTDPPGYIWSFPRPDHLAIGVCAQADAGVRAEALRAIVLRWIEQTGIAKGAELHAYSWPIPTLASRDFRALDVAGPGWLAIGDAAGLVDPITREGIFFALQSAAFAAEALATARDPSRLYTTRVRDEIGSELERAARYKAGFFRPRFTRLFIDALRSSNAVRQVMADLVAGTQSYRTLKWRLARTFEFGLAWRMLTGAKTDARDSRLATHD